MTDEREGEQDDDRAVINTDGRPDPDPGDAPDQPDVNGDTNRIDERIKTLATSAAEDREAFESPATPPDEERARELLREGFGPAVWVYVEGHTGGRNRKFDRAELALLERAMNDWLELYAQCYGVDLDARFSVREAAELLVETRNVRETAQLLTRVPGR